MINCVFEDGGKGSLRHVVVHAIVEKDGKFLLVKRAKGIIEPEKWCLPSGFLGRDETAKEGVLRELKEETGWEGEVIGLLRVNSNPNRPHEDRQNLGLDFIVKAKNEVGKSDKEQTKVEWVATENLPPFEDFAFDHGESIKCYLEYRKNPFPLPVLI